MVVGVEPAQIRFLEQQLRTKAQRVERVNDDMLSGVTGELFQVYASHCVDLSPELRGRTALWSADPIGKGSSTVHAIVKLALTLVEYRKPPTKDTIQLVESMLDKDKIEDICAVIWKAVWLLLSDPKPPKRWVEPWEAPGTWFVDVENPEQRLNGLLNLLSNYAYFVEYGEEAIKELKIPPKEAQKIRNLHLDPTSVYQTVTRLSQWQQGKWDIYVCALLISVAWTK